jgi:tetratricopeptide (TPR) repeat protein
MKIRVVRKYFLFVIAFAFLSSSFSAQNKTIDSLRVALKNTKHDTMYCKVFMELTETLAQNGFSKEWPKLSQQLLDFSQKKINLKEEPKKLYLKARAYAQGNLGYYDYTKGDTTNALIKYREAIKTYTELNDHVGIAVVYTWIGDLYLSLLLSTPADFYYNKAMEMTDNINETPLLLMAGLESIVRFTERKGINSQTLKFTRKLYDFYTKTGNSRKAGEALNSLALCYIKIGDINTAFEFYNSSLKKNTDERATIFALANLGELYAMQGDSTKALANSKIVLDYAKKNNDKHLIASVYASRGSLYQGFHFPSKAEKYFLKSLKIREETEDYIYVAQTSNLLADLYISENNLSKSIFYCNKSLEIYEALAHKSGISATLILLAKAKLKQNLINEALLNAKKAYQLSLEMGYPENLMDVAKILKNIYRKQNKNSEAFDMFELEIRMRDSIKNQGVQEKMMITKFQEENLKKELAAKAEQDKKDATAAEEKRKQALIRNVIAIGLAFVLLFAAFIFRSLQITRKQKNLIENQKKEVENSKAELQIEKQKVDNAHKDIKDSINYAKRIQQAQMPTEKYIEKKLKDLKK